MRYAALFGILGSLLARAALETASAAASWRSWTVAAIETYGALSLLTLALAYGLNPRGIALGGASRCRGWGRTVGVLLLPYRCLARFTCALLHRFDSMEPMHLIGNRLYVGRRPLGSERVRLREAGVTAILNLCVEFPGPSPSSSRRGGRAMGGTEFERAYVPILDGAAPTAGQFREALDWIESRHAAGHSVLIHCAQGRGRSVAVAAAALCRLGMAAGPDEAIAQIRAVRPRVKPSRSQCAALARFLGADGGGTRPGPRPALIDSMT